MRPRTLWSLVVAAAILGSMLAASTSSAAPIAERYVHEAVALYNKGECVKAIALLKKALAADARYVRAHSWLGFCYARLGRNGDAIGAFQRVVALAPKSEDARVAQQWIRKLQQPAPRPTTTAPPASPPPGPQVGLVYLITLQPVVGVGEANLPLHVQLFGETYRRALVERRNWWQGRRTFEREWRVVYNLQRKYTRFRAKVGVEDAMPQEFAATFEVRVDGNTLFESKPKRSGDVPDGFDVDVTGALQLELIVRGKDLLHTRDLSVVWADPALDSRPAANQPGPAPGPSNQPAPPPSPPGAPPQPVPGPGASLPGIMDARCGLRRLPHA